MWANASAVQIKGKKHFRISGFSGVDLTAMFKVRPCLQLLDVIYEHAYSGLCCGSEPSSCRREFQGNSASLALLAVCD